MDAPDRRRRRFGLFELDLNAGELRREGVRVRLQEQPLQILSALIERPGEAVTRDALRQRVWPAGVTVDFDRGLNSAVRKLRIALGESSDNPRFIETLPKHGYRFIAPVTETDDSTPPLDDPSPASRYPSNAVHARSRRRAGVIAASILAAVVLLVATYFQRGYRVHVEISRPEATASPEYVRSRPLILNYNETNLREAIERLDGALRVDPSDGLARSGLATSLAWFSVRYAREADAALWARRASVEATVALAHAPQLAEAHVARAYAAATVSGGPDWPLVAAEGDTALHLDPTVALAHVVRAEAFYHLGLFDSADAELVSASGIERASSVETERVRLATELLRGRFAHVSDAAAQLRQRTDAPIIGMYLGTALFYLGKYEQAEDVLSSIKRENDPDFRSQAMLASVLAATGRYAEARMIVEHVMSARYIDHHVAYSVGAALAQLGRKADAVQWLRRSADEGFPCYPWFASDPLLVPVRDTPTFRALLQDLRARFDSARSRYGQALGH